MNKNGKSLVLSILALLLLVQPAVHSFGLDQIKSALVSNFEVVKPYCTFGNLFKTALVGSILCFVGYIVYQKKYNKALVPDLEVQLKGLIAQIEEKVQKSALFDEKFIKVIGKITRKINKVPTDNHGIQLSEAINQLCNAIKEYNSALQDDAGEKEAPKRDFELVMKNIKAICEDINRIILEKKDIKSIASKQDSKYEDEDQSGDKEDNNELIISIDELEIRIKSVKRIAGLCREISEEVTQSINPSINAMNNCTLDDEAKRLFAAIDNYNKILQSIDSTQEKENIKDVLAPTVKIINGASEYILSVLALKKSLLKKYI